MQTTNTFYLSLETFTMGIFAMLILCSLVLFIVRPNEQYLIALLFVSLVTMAVSIIDHRAGQLGITLSAFTAFRSSLFIAPSVLTTAIVFYLLGDQRGEWHHPLFSLRYSFLATLAIVFIQFFCPYNFNYILRVVLLILLFPVFCRAAQNHVDGTLLLSLGYGLAEGARIFIYLLNTPSVWHSGAPAILLRLTQIGYLIQLVFCLIVVLKRFAQKFNEADELILSLDQKVADRTQALQKASREMQRAKESEHEVMINILHDLRTPIFHIQGCLDMLRSTDEEQHSLIEKLHERVEYLQSLTESSFLAAKVKDGQISFHFHETDLVPLCQYAIDSSKTAMEKRHLSLNAVLPSTLSTSTDGLRYRQVVENLLSNAVQYAPENTEIDLTLFSGKNDICLTVKNRSEDMTEELLLRIFDRFTHGASRDSTGLGLFIARKLSTGLGGSLNASLDQGIITFTFIIPHQINREIAQQ